MSVLMDVLDKTRIIIGKVLGVEETMADPPQQPPWCQGDADIDPSLLRCLIDASDGEIVDGDKSYTVIAMQ